MLSAKNHQSRYNTLRIANSTRMPCDNGHVQLKFVVDVRCDYWPEFVVYVERTAITDYLVIWYALSCERLQLLRMSSRCDIINGFYLLILYQLRQIRDSGGSVSRNILNLNIMCILAFG